MTCPEPPPTHRDPSPTMRGMCGREWEDLSADELASRMPRELEIDGDRVELVWVPLRGVGSERGPRA